MITKSKVAVAYRGIFRGRMIRGVVRAKNIVAATDRLTARGIIVTLAEIPNDDLPAFLRMTAQRQMAKRPPRTIGQNVQPRQAGRPSVCLPRQP